jgi:DNA topoisomerase-6 subunit B
MVTKARSRSAKRQTRGKAAGKPARKPQGKPRIRTNRPRQAELPFDEAAPEEPSAPAADETEATPAAGTPAEPEVPPEAEGAIPEPEQGKVRTASRSFRKRNAVELARDQREIAVSEFFLKNRHLLGFDNPKKALLTAIKEAVDNSLDACEEAGILPNIEVEILREGEDRYRIGVEDNGPGIVPKMVPNVFGKLLFGSKFHRLKQSRGQQGIGISAAGMYGQLTTGRPVEIISKPFANKPATYTELLIDTKKNEPKVTLKQEDATNWKDGWTGTRVRIHMEAEPSKGKQSVDTYLEHTVLANPHATIAFTPPEGEKETYARTVEQMPVEPKAIKPHPKGVELGMMIKMLQSTKARNVASFLKSEFSRISAAVAGKILEAAGIPSNSSPKRIAMQDVEKLYRAINSDGLKIMNPPLNCLSPIGEEQILKSLKARLEAQFYAAVSRSPAVYRGNPFLVEAGIAWGVKDMDPEGLVKVYRYANKVPLFYQPGSCAITQAVMETDWKNYSLSQSRGALPAGPAVVFVHMASVWVPFTSESKEAVAPYPEIVKEIKLALQECGRQLGAHLRHAAHVAHEARRRSIFEKYIEEVVQSASAVAKINADALRKHLLAMAHKKTGGGDDGEIPEDGEAGPEAAVPGNGDDAREPGEGGEEPVD